MNTADEMMVNSSTTADIDIEVSEIYTLTVPITDTLIDQSDDSIRKTGIDNFKKIPVVVTYCSPAENSSTIRAVSLQHAVMFAFPIRNSNRFETFVPDKHAYSVLITAFNYMKLVRKLPVVNEFSLMEILAQLHRVPLAELWRKTEPELQSLRVVHESLSREKAGGGITERYQNIEREFEEMLAAVNEVDWVSNPKLTQELIWRDEIRHHEYAIETLKTALNLVPDTMVKVTPAAPQPEALDTTDASVKVTHATQPPKALDTDASVKVTHVTQPPKALDSTDASVKVTHATQRPKALDTDAKVEKFFTLRRLQASADAKAKATHATRQPTALDIDAKVKMLRRLQASADAKAKATHATRQPKAMDTDASVKITHATRQPTALDKFPDISVKITPATQLLKASNTDVPIRSTLVTRQIEELLTDSSVKITHATGQPTALDKVPDASVKVTPATQQLNALNTDALMRVDLATQPPKALDTTDASVKVTHATQPPKALDTAGATVELFYAMRRLQALPKALLTDAEVEFIRAMRQLKALIDAEEKTTHATQQPKALDKVPDTSVKVTSATQQQKATDSLRDPLVKFVRAYSLSSALKTKYLGIYGASALKQLYDLSIELQLKYEEALSKPYPWSDHSSSELLSPPIFC